MNTHLNIDNCKLHQLAHPKLVGYFLNEKLTRTHHEAVN